MGLLALLQTPRWLAGRESPGEPLADQFPLRTAQTRARMAGTQAAAAAAARILGDLKTLERRYGFAVAPSAVRLRSAVLLHRAGHKAEAWKVFGRMLADPSLGGAPALRPIMESEIYARMRMALEREGCHNPAITPAVLSYATRAQFYEMHDRRAELDVLRSEACFDRHFTPLLERARLVSILPALHALVEEHLGSLPALDIATFRAALEALRRNPPDAAAAAPDRPGQTKQR